MLGTIDFIVSELWAPFNFPWRTALKFSSVSTTDPSRVFLRFDEDHMAKSGNRLVQSVEHLTAEQEVVGSIPRAKPILGSQNN